MRGFAGKICPEITAGGRVQEQVDAVISS